jgi:16S rRNA (uracil1498-N3)-methyltransferase
LAGRCYGIIPVWKRRANPLTRIYFPDLIPDHGLCQLPVAKAHHVAHVLRLAPGDAVTLFDGQGNAWDAVISKCARGDVSVQLKGRRGEDRESPLQLTLAQAVSSGERMDYTIQKAVELGISVIQPLIAERCVVRLSGERAAKRVAHWQGVVAASCEQCGRNRVPVVKPLLSLRDWLDEAAAAGGTRLLLAPDGPALLRELPRPAGMVTVLAGPEGGFTASEAADAVRFGFQPLQLGPRILRTETAAVALLAAMQALWGDF